MVTLFAIEQSAQRDDFLGATARDSIAGKACAILGCDESQSLVKCSVCPAHYCSSHVRIHIHRGREL